MAFGDKVQSKAALEDVDVSSIAVTLDGAVGSGNLLVATVASRGSGATIAITDWNSFGAVDPPSHQQRAFWLAADDLASLTVTASITAANEMAMTVVEYEGPFDFDALLNTSNNAHSGTVSVASQTTGEVTTTVDDCLLVGMVAVIDVTGTLGSWSDSFLADDTGGPTSHSTDVTVAQGHLAVAATGAYSSSFSWTNARRASGIIGAFAAGSGSVFDPDNFQASVLDDDVTLTWDA